jgi:hypothetical protein
MKDSLIKLFYMFNVFQHFKNIKKIYSLNFKLIFIIKYITGIFQKKIIQLNNTSEIKEFKKIYTEGSYSFNWTTANSHNFLTIFKVLKNKHIGTLVSAKEDNKNSSINLKILEIGSFEGYSANIFSKIFDRSEIYCVDPWIPYSEHLNLNFNKIEKNFDKNTKNLNVKKFKMFSSNFFKNNSENFDLIYIDGSHAAADVLFDAMESYNILNKGGVLFFDDFLGSQTFDHNGPIDGIATFLKKTNFSNLKLIFINSQCAFLKL